MRAKVNAWSGLLGCLVLLAASAPTSGPAQTLTGADLASAGVPAAPAPVVSPSPTQPAWPGATGSLSGAERVKFYVVVDAGQGHPDSLTALAGRLLGATGRAQDILHLNAGRRQADGGALTDSMELRLGWTLVLPWDAVGAGVQYGVLPTGPTGSPPGSPPPAAPTPGGSAPPANGGAPGKGDSCTLSAGSPARSRWAYDRMAADEAWGRTRGEGVLVAVIDTGVDAEVPQLTGRVAIGADILTGSGQGNTDCFGSGTAMAGIVAAAPAESATEAGNQMVGLAPAATILPLRVVTDTPHTTEPGDAATAIEVAVSAGVRVITLGAYVDLTDPAVLDAVRAARSHDVVVVAPAPIAPGGSGTAAALSKPDSLLLVGGVGPDGQPAADYRPDTVDVLAPGMDVASLGPRGTGARANSGSQYAAAFAAGAVTLVRSAYPNLTAAQVVNRIKATAERAGQDGPDPVVGWGMINPNAAVTVVLAAETVTSASGGAASSPLRALTIGLVVVVGIAAVTVLARRSSIGPAELVEGRSAGQPAAQRVGRPSSAADATSTVPPVEAGPVTGPVGAPATGTGESTSTAPAPSQPLVDPGTEPGPVVAKAGAEDGGSRVPARR
ncbi:peptidase S8 and S53 subtilisin kexin sedolisin [Micromonospora zingiberis]|uniref:Peptidase S8 and S53 subtilisin kexin sedolisin n=1 Tax=Micromonospora zingiberis TaxID=2053011 RepID=A0A4R0GGR4_9ACTN|nr:S8 family serine peptidase [Micromonospora zingiberis]TCB95423.1 peptidase S8 and S53 subtilisin kexin sedolisin [Micromonospora zingiberis]